MTKKEVNRLLELLAKFYKEHMREMSMDDSVKVAGAIRIIDRILGEESK